MSDFVESAKNFLNTAVSRTSWEAQKQLRLRSKQSEVEKLLDQRQQLLNDLAIVAMNLYTQGALTDSQLTRLCASILELDNDVKKREQQLQDIKNEPFPADQLGPTPTTNYAPPPVTPTPSAAHTPGATAQPAPSGGAQPQAEHCPSCGNIIRPNALYCRSCGAKLR